MVAIAGTEPFLQEDPGALHSTGLPRLHNLVLEHAQLSRGNAFKGYFHLHAIQSRASSEMAAWPPLWELARPGLVPHTAVSRGLGEGRTLCMCCTTWNSWGRHIWGCTAGAEMMGGPTLLGDVPQCLW